MIAEGKLAGSNSQILPFTEGADYIKLVFPDGTTKELKIGD